MYEFTLSDCEQQLMIVPADTESASPAVNDSALMMIF